MVKKLPAILITVSLMGLILGLVLFSMIVSRGPLVSTDMPIIWTTIATFLLSVTSSFSSIVLSQRLEGEKTE